MLGTALSNPREAKTPSGLSTATSDPRIIMLTPAYDVPRVSPSGTGRAYLVAPCYAWSRLAGAPAALPGCGRAYHTLRKVLFCRDFPAGKSRLPFWGNPTFDPLHSRRKGSRLRLCGVFVPLKGEPHMNGVSNNSAQTFQSLRGVKSLKVGA